IRPRSYRRTGYRTGEILLFGPAMGVPSYLRIRTTVSGSRPLNRRGESRGTILIYVAHRWHGWRRRIRMGPLTRFLMTTFHLEPCLRALVFAMFGIGAAAKVASTLAMVNDHANVENRAQLFAFFDLVTFGGLVGGFGAGFLALKASVAEAVVLAAGGLGVAASVVIVQFLVRETEFMPEPQRGTI